MSEEFNDPRLAALYDVLNPWAADSEFYFSLASGCPGVLDLGCGTGMLACACAERGHRVVGVDPASPMLDIARTRAYGDRVEWVESTAQAYRSDRRFDLIVMTGHVFQFFLTDEDVQAVLGTMRRHLADGGRVAFETRNPRRRAWANWTPERSFRTVEAAGIGKVGVWTEVNGADGDLVSYAMGFRVPGVEEALISPGTLRFLPKPALMEHLTRAGLRIDSLYGDWSRAPLSGESPEIIVVARAWPAAVRGAPGR